MKTTTTLLTLTLTSTTLANTLYAQRAPILPRAISSTFYGGWPLVSDSCPTGTDSCSKGKNGGSCCPTGTECVTNSQMGEPVCCPIGSDCARSASAVPVCSDPSWTLYIGKYHYFCCKEGEQGTFDPEGTFGKSPVCLGSNVPVQSTDLATRYSTKGGSKTVGAGGSKTTAVTVPTQTDSADAEVTDVADVGGQVTQTSASSAATPTGVTSSNDAGRVVGGSAALGLGVMFMGATFVL